ncbi:MAG: phosphatase PAP2 family protein [Pseudolabrys sp.]|nr:phosphatase PAP2 family protein [Pseudolabrys sp.]
MSAAQDLPAGAGSSSALRRCLLVVAASLQRLLRPGRGRGAVSSFGARGTVVAAAIALAAVLACMVLLDAAAVRAVLGLPRIVPWFFGAITDYGKSGWFLWPLGVLFVMLAALPRERLTRMSQRVLAAIMVRVGFLFLAIAVPGLLVAVVKRIIGRARPLVPGTVDPFVFSPFVWRADYASMPSGHTTTAFAALVAFGSLWPRARTVLWIYALAIAASRIAITAHFPSDVLAAAIVGVVGALLVRRHFALRRLGFSLGYDGVLRAWPGPSPRRIKAVVRELLAP